MRGIVRLSVAAAATAMTIAAIVIAAGPATASCEGSPPGAAVQGVAFRGQVTAIDGSRITFHVDEVLAVPPDVELAPGDATAVDLGDDAYLLDVGVEYRVAATGPAGAWSSRVSADDGGPILGWAERCGGGSRTTFADGTPIETNWFVRHHVGAWAIALVVAMSALIVVVEGAKAVRRPIRHRPVAPRAGTASRPAGRGN